MIGPNCPGIITPGESLAGITPHTIAGKGPVGLVSKSGTLTYQMMYELRDFGFSTAIGIGGDPIVGTTHIDALAAFEADPDTKAIVMIGEIGGDAEERAAAYIKDHVTKPVVGYVAGLHRPRGQDHGPRRRHRVRLLRHRAGQEGGPRGRRREGRQDAVRDRPADAGDPRGSTCRRADLAGGSWLSGPSAATSAVTFVGAGGLSRSVRSCWTARTRAAPRGRGPSDRSMNAPGAIATPWAGMKPICEIAVPLRSTAIW